jgi:glutaredoxin
MVSPFPHLSSSADTRDHSTESNKIRTTSLQLTIQVPYIIIASIKYALVFQIKRYLQYHTLLTIHKLQLHPSKSLC